MQFSPIMAIGAGIVSAIAMFSIAFGSILALPVFYLAPLPLYMAGLGLGGHGALIASIAAIGAVALIGGAVAALPFAVAYGMPVVSICRQALTKFPGAGGQPVFRPAGNIVASLTVFGMCIILFAGFMAMMDENTVALEKTVGDFITQALTAMQSDVNQEQLQVIVGSLATYFPGMAIASWTVMHLVNAAAAQGALVKSGRNIRPNASYAALELPDWCSWLLVGSGVMSLVLSGNWGYIGDNLVIVALVPFFLLGLAVAHTFARTKAQGTMMLVLFYMLIVVIGWAAFLVAAIGVLEQWVGLRHRMPPAINQETE